MGALGIDPALLITQLVNFFLLLGVLMLFAYRPIRRMLDERAQRIRESMEQAEQIKRRMAQTQEEVKAHLEAARREGQAIVAQASRMGEQLREETRQEARREAEMLVARARAEIERERREMVDRLRQEFADIAIEAAEKVIHQTVDRRAHRRLVQEVLEESTALRKEG
ncbi:MAG TPA: F0F1 ATP synthase subunit B [Dehalococcoidia bacterium]|jgi:F-type H+-transporting ATPase subunit b|nr:F0F1 ATP synthase subunit B [Dehalococcoidia bacterium]